MVYNYKGQPPLKIDDLGGFPPNFGLTPICFLATSWHDDRFPPPFKAATIFFSKDIVFHGKPGLFRRFLLLSIPTPVFVRSISLGITWICLDILASKLQIQVAGTRVRKESWETSWAERRKAPYSWETPWEWCQCCTWGAWVFGGWGL